MQKDEERGALTTVVKRMAVSAVFGFIVCLAVLLLASALFAIGALPAWLVPTVAVLACVAGGLVAGLRLARKQQSYMIWMGAAAGLAIFVLFYLLGAVVYTRLAPSENSLPIFLASLGGGVGGGVLNGLIKMPKHKKLR